MPTTTSSVIAGCSSQSQRHRERVATIRPTATITAQPTCSEGIAANWFAIVSVAGVAPYTVGP